MSVAEQVLQLLRSTEAVLEGHFLLTSGLHSGGYVQCAKVLQYPRHAEALGRWIAEQFRTTPIDLVISPAVGGIIIGQEVARALDVRAVFSERENGAMTLRRGLEVVPGERVLVVEDVTTTGGSVREVMQAVQARAGQVVGVGAVLNRSPEAIDMGVPFHPLATLHLQSYAPEACPLCAQGSQPVKPGSRP
ncbi:MAG: orotate phosphoribosyltransferase, partial [Candidatus Tectomicrobia bacterium]|nr:orotate phosphoribosyltransferase [Candidatus Tectomicrobia bacterium]